jgi:hypothetical protein
MDLFFLKITSIGFRRGKIEARINQYFGEEIHRQVQYHRLISVDEFVEMYENW